MRPVRAHQHIHHPIPIPIPNDKLLSNIRNARPLDIHNPRDIPLVRAQLLRVPRQPDHSVSARDELEGEMGAAEAGGSNEGNVEGSGGVYGFVFLFLV